MSKNLKKIFADDPEMLRLIEQKESNELLKELVKDKVVSDSKTTMVKIEYLKGEQGEKGDPLTWEDLTEEQKLELKGEDGKTPIKGVDYDDGKDGHTPTKNELEAIIRPLIPTPKVIHGTNGKDGKDGSPDKPDDIARKLNTLKEALDPTVIKGYETFDSILEKIKKGRLIELKDIAGARLDNYSRANGGYNMNDQRWHGGGSGGGGGGSITVKEVDGTPTVPDVTTIVFPNDSVTNNGSGTVTINPLVVGNPVINGDPTRVLYIDNNGDLATDVYFQRVLDLADVPYGLLISDANQNIFISHNGASGNTTTTGTTNIGIGGGTLTSLTTGVGNTVIGDNAGSNITTATDSYIMGNNAGASITSAVGSIAIGSSALRSLSTGNQNIAIGQNVMYNSDGVTQNVAIGTGSLRDNTGGDYNVSVGYLAGRFVTTGDNNTFVGKEAGRGDATGLTGANSTGIGNGALYALSTGATNTALGYNAGSAVTTASNTVHIGGYVGSPTISNNVVLSDGAGNIRFIGNSVTNPRPFGIGLYFQDANYANSAIGVKIDSNFTTSYEFNPSSGAANWIAVEVLGPALNATGTWGGGYFGISLRPTLTAAPSGSVVVGYDWQPDNTGVSANIYAFLGRVGLSSFGLGNTLPTAYVHAEGSPAGAAGTASYKINPGTLLATEESGAIESDGDHIYWTDQTNVRYQLDNQVAAGIEVGVTQIVSGTANRILFENASNDLGESADFTWDDTNKQLFVRGNGTGATKPFVIQNSASAERFSVENDGTVNFTGPSGAMRAEPQIGFYGYSFRSVNGGSYIDMNGGNMRFYNSSSVEFMNLTTPSNGRYIGKIRINNSAFANASALLHLDGSSAGAASTASMKIEPGTLLATEESGAVESDGTHIYWTDSGNTRYQLDQQAGMSWTEVTGTSQSMSVSNGYILNNGSLVTATLPTTASVGSIVAVVGKGSGGWSIAQNSGQTIHFGNTDTTTGTGGSLSSTNQYDSIELICTTANTDWVVRNSIGNITVV